MPKATTATATAVIEAPDFAPQDAEAAELDSVLDVAQDVAARRAAMAGQPATPTAEAATIAPIPRADRVRIVESIPYHGPKDDAEYVAIGTLCNRINTDPYTLRHRAATLGIDVLDALYVPRSSVGRLVGSDALANAILASHKEVTIGQEGMSRALSVHFSTVRRFLTLRNAPFAIPNGPGAQVVMDPGPLAGFAGMLKAEKAQPITPGDWFDVLAIRPTLRKQIPIQYTGGAGTADFQGPDGRGDPEKVRIFHELWDVSLLGAMGIRWRRWQRFHWLNGQLQANGFDLYRLAGILCEPDSEAEYLERIAAAAAGER